jgi:hypothetical protein
MSEATTRILAHAAGTPLCDVVVIGVKPGGDLYVDWTGSTLASLFLFLKLAEREAMDAWDVGVDLHRREKAA